MRQKAGPPRGHWRATPHDAQYLAHCALTPCRIVILSAPRRHLVSLPPPTAFLLLAGAMLSALESAMTVRRPSLFRHLLPLLALGAFAVPGHAETTGTLDTNFSGDGVLLDAWGATSLNATAIALVTPSSTTSNVWVAGLDVNASIRHLVLRRFDHSGNNILNGSGFLAAPSGYTLASPTSGSVAMVLQSGKPVLACLANNGSNNVILLARFTANGDIDGDGVLDGTLTTDGLAAVSLPYEVQSVSGLAIDGNGRFVVVGQAQNSGATANIFTIASINTDGSLYTSFGSGGILQPSLTSGSTMSSAATGVTIDADGKIVTCGWAQAVVNSTVYQAMAVTRCSTTGVLDTTFSSGGMYVKALGLTDAVAKALVVQTDGKIAVAGSAVNSDSVTSAAVLRLTTAGLLDTSFSDDGYLLTAFGTSSYATAIAQYPDARLVISGYAKTSTTDGFLLARYSTGGTLDTSVGSSGIAAFNTGSTSIQQPANGLALVGSTYAYLTGTGISGSTPTFTTLRLNFTATSDSGSTPDNSGSPYINTSCGLGSGIALGGLLALGILLRLRLRRR